jgi:hypothetical protein
MSILLGMGLFEKRLDAQPVRNGLDFAPGAFSFFMMAYIWGAYEYMAHFAYE